MTTQAVISLVKNDHVSVKIVCGCNGYSAEKLVKIIIDNNIDKIQDIYDVALENKFGCRDCLVVMDNENIIFDDGEDPGSLYRETFDKPSFNPRWKNGTADYIVVSKIDNPEWGLV